MNCSPRFPKWSWTKQNAVRPSFPQTRNTQARKSERQVREDERKTNSKLGKPSESDVVVDAVLVRLLASTRSVETARG